MATTKRMFSNDIVGSDAFIEMPTTSQALYFHLGMRCDDDGFVNPNVTMRMTGANKNDLDILIGKRFLLPFKIGVVVIKHHRINNNWDSRDSRRTLYTEELRQLFIKDNNAYTFDVEQGQLTEEKYFTNKGVFAKKQLPVGNPSGTRAVSADRIEENRIEENRIEENKGTATKVARPSLLDIEDYVKDEKITFDSKKFFYYYESNGWKVGKNPMKSWKMAVKSWHSKDNKETSQGQREIINLKEYKIK